MAIAYHDDRLEIFETWEAYNLKAALNRGILELGFETPSFIQKTAIYPIIMRQDIRAQAQSGTGKTAAFGIGALQILDEHSPTSQILILVSTREIAAQNANRISQLAKYMNITMAVIIGGTNPREDIEICLTNPQIVVGTPGRVAHMLKDGHLAPTFKLCIIDEADELMRKGFKPQIYDIFTRLDAYMQVAMFSATWPEEAMLAVHDFCRNPVIIDLRQDEQTLKGILQFYVNLGNKPRQQSDFAKMNVLLDLFQGKNVGQCIIFCSARARAEQVGEALLEKGIPSRVIHGSVGARERNETLNKFREGSIRFLVATDVLSRGIDIQQLSVVINYDLPVSKNVDGEGYTLDRCNYIHRIGRAGRFGRKGLAINFVFSEEMGHIKDIEDYYRTSIVPLPEKMNLQ